MLQPHEGWFPKNGGFSVFATRDRFPETVVTRPPPGPHFLAVPYWSTL